jgi:hypothetical protein
VCEKSPGRQSVTTWANYGTKGEGKRRRKEEKERGEGKRRRKEEKERGEGKRRGKRRGKEEGKRGGEKRRGIASQQQNDGMRYSPNAHAVPHSLEPSFLRHLLHLT